jgi:hypothetical protein
MSYSPSSAPSCSACSRAFSSEVDPGSRQENASKQETRAPLRFNRNGKGASRSQQHHVFQSQDVFSRKHYSRRQDGGCAVAWREVISACGLVAMRLQSLPEQKKRPTAQASTRSVFDCLSAIVE